MARRWLVAAALLLALGGCGDERDAEPATVPVPMTSSARPVPSGPATLASGQAAAAPARTTPTAAGRNPAGFAAEVRRELPGLLLDHRDEEILALAQQSCTSLAAGRSAGAVVAGVRTAGTDRASARRLVTLAITTVCPDQDRRLAEF